MASEEQLESTQIERITSVHAHDGYEEVSAVFSDFTDISLGVSGNFGQILNQIKYYVFLNDKSLAEIVNENSATENCVIASWWTDAYGKRTLTLAFKATLPDTDKVVNGTTLTIKSGLIIPENKQVSSDFSFTYNANQRIWQSSQNIPNLNIISSAMSVYSTHIDFSFDFDYAPDVMINNAFMATLGGAFHDVNNPASPIYYDANNAYWGANFNCVKLNEQTLLEWNAKNSGLLQFWWSGNGTAKRTFILRLVVTGGNYASFLKNGDILTIDTNFVTCENQKLASAVSFVFGENGFTAEQKKAVNIKKATPVSPYVLPEFSMQYFSLQLDFDVETQLSVHELQSVSENIIINGKTLSQIGSCEHGKIVQINVTGSGAVGGPRLDIWIVENQGEFKGLKLDGTDYITLPANLKIGALTIEKEHTFYNYGAKFGNGWYTQKELDIAQSIEQKISALSSFSEKQEILNVYNEYGLLEEQVKSLVKNYSNLQTLLNEIAKEENILKDYNALNVLYYNGNSESFVNCDILLVKEGPFGSKIAWSSSNPQVISENGKVNIARGATQVKVTLTATIGEENSMQKTFELYVQTLPYSVTFKDAQGQTLKTVEQDESGKVTPPTLSNVKGYTFLGWFEQGASTAFDLDNQIEKDVTLFAKYQVIKYSITYNLNGGTNAQGAPAEYDITNADITLPIPQKQGFDFVGWYSDETFKNEVKIIYTQDCKEITLYALWSKTVYKINYVLNGGTKNENPTTYSDEQGVIELKPVSKHGYTFGGWYSDSDYKNKVESIDCSQKTEITLYAKWIDSEKKSGCNSSISASAVLSIIILGAVCVMKRSKV